MTSALPVLWLYGPSGVGKSAVGWELYTRLSSHAVPVAYVDIDYLGMSYGPPTPRNWAPEPASDPVRHRLKAVNLDAVAANARDAGAAGLIVSGIVDPEHGIDVDLLPNVALTAIRLRAELEEIRRRLDVRGRPDEPIDEILRDAEALDRSDFPGGGAYVDTTALGVDEVLEQVTKHAEGWPAVRATPLTAASVNVTQDSGGSIFWLCGPRPAGLSAVAFQVYRLLRLDGTRAAYLDLEQVGFLRPAPAGDPENHRFKAANLASVWRTFRASGAECLVAVGSADDAEVEAAYAAVLPGVELAVCRADLDPKGRPADEIAREILAEITVPFP
jgi:adenylylsulfate kinase-like enzyme